MCFCMRATKDVLPADDDQKALVPDNGNLHSLSPQIDERELAGKEDIDDDSLFQRLFRSKPKRLLRAAHSGDVEMICTLLEKNVDVDAVEKDSSRQTALMEASKMSQKETIGLLLDRGADVNCQNAYGWAALHWAVDKGNEDVVQLLLTRNAILNKKSKYGSTPLMIAATNGQIDIAKLLLTHNGRINEQNTEGQTPLLTAVKTQNMEMVQSLLLARANANVRDNKKDSPLHEATRNGSLELVRLLVTSGANCDLKNKHARTPLSIAQERGDFVIEAILDQRTFGWSVSEPSTEDEYDFDGNRKNIQNSLSSDLRKISLSSGGNLRAKKLVGKVQARLADYVSGSATIESGYEGEESDYELTTTNTIRESGSELDDCETGLQFRIHRSSSINGKNFDVDTIRISQPVFLLKAKLQQGDHEHGQKVAEILRKSLLEFRTLYPHLEKARPLIDEAQIALNKYDLEMRPLAERYAKERLVMKSEALMDALQAALVIKDVEKCVQCQKELGECYNDIMDICKQHPQEHKDAYKFTLKIETALSKLVKEMSTELAEEEMYNLCRTVKSSLTSLLNYLEQENSKQAIHHKKELENGMIALQKYSNYPRASKILDQARDTLGLFDETIQVIC